MRPNGNGTVSMKGRGEASTEQGKGLTLMERWVAYFSTISPLAKLLAQGIPPSAPLNNLSYAKTQNLTHNAGFSYWDQISTEGEVVHFPINLQPHKLIEVEDLSAETIREAIRQLDAAHIYCDCPACKSWDER